MELGGIRIEALYIKPPVTARVPHKKPLGYPRRWITQPGDLGGVEVDRISRLVASSHLLSPHRSNTVITRLLCTARNLLLAVK